MGKVCNKCQQVFSDDQKLCECGVGFEYFVEPTCAVCGTPISVGELCEKHLNQGQPHNPHDFQIAKGDKQ